MGSSGVQQLDVLSDLFATALDISRPSSVAILGITGGNGLAHIDSRLTPRVVGVDINGEYLDSVRQRYPHLTGLELHSIDLAAAIVDLPSVKLVHAALIFEHAGTTLALENALSLVSEDGYFSAVLQLPSESEQGVSPSEFTTMHNLKSHFVLVDPEWFQETLMGRGWRLEEQTRRQLARGKALWMGIFRRD